MNSMPLNSGSQFLLYKTESGDTRIDVLIKNESVWLTQKQMSDLFAVGIPAINKHLKNIFESAELQEVSVISILETTASDGKKYETKFYNLDAIISVGYRVNSVQATNFRRWATQILRQYIIKGFAMNDERLKNPQTVFGTDYFEELLERVRSIRASERRVYQKITDIFTACSIDYDPQSDITRTFYATVQNKFHYAITGQTAAEIIASRADATKPHMGLTTWKNAPKGRIYKYDTLIAKNYLAEEQIRSLERLITGYLDYIERLIEKRTTFTMQTLSESIQKFLTFNEYAILENAGVVSHADMERIVEKEYEKFRTIHDREVVSDFDRQVQKITEIRGTSSS